MATNITVPRRECKPTRASPRQWWFSTQPLSNHQPKNLSTWKWVYPPMCGGTRPIKAALGSTHGLSPRVSGNPEYPGALWRSVGFIPACAGGTVCPDRPDLRTARLSSRVRGNAERVIVFILSHSPRGVESLVDAGTFCEVDRHLAASAYLASGVTPWKTEYVDNGKLVGKHVSQVPS